MHIVQKILDSLDGILKGITNGINDLANQIFEFVLLMLPVSPFANLQLDPIFADFLGYLNYYCPMSTLLGIMLSWLGCIATYYAWQLILRYIKAVS